MLEQRKTKWTFPRDTKKEKCIWGWVVNPRAFTLQHSPSPFFRHTVTRGHCSIFARKEFADALWRERDWEGGEGGGGGALFPILARTPSSSCGQTYVFNNHHAAIAPDFLLDFWLWSDFHCIFCACMHLSRFCWAVRMHPLLLVWWL